MHKIPLVMAREYKFSKSVQLEPGDTLGELHVPDASVLPIFVANGIVNGMVKAIVETPVEAKEETAAAPAAAKPDESFDAAGE